jgi:uncharacterized cupredoxin-like copper-binding protein
VIAHPGDDKPIDKEIEEMQRLLVLAFGLTCALGAVTFAVAQDASPTATPSTACASPVPATPTMGTPTMTASTPAATPEACAPAPAAVTIELVDIAFKPKEATLPAGGPATLTIQNNGLALHNFSIDALDISVDLGPGESQTVTIDTPAGDYDYYCNIPGHAQAGMVGVLHIT